MHKYIPSPPNLTPSNTHKLVIHVYCLLMLKCQKYILHNKFTFIFTDSNSVLECYKVGWNDGKDIIPCPWCYKYKVFSLRQFHKRRPRSHHIWATMQESWSLEFLTMFEHFYETKRQMSRIVRKPDFCLGENKGADQLRGNREADQRLCFRYSDSTIPLLLKSEISSF